MILLTPDHPLKIIQMKQHNKYLTWLSLFLFTGLGCTQKLVKNAGAGEIQISAQETVNPVFRRFESNPVIRFQMIIPENSKVVQLRQVLGRIESGSWQDISKLEVYSSKSGKDQLLGAISPSGKNFNIPLQASLNPGKQEFWLNVQLKDNADMNGAFSFRIKALKDAVDQTYAVAQAKPASHQVGYTLRKSMDEGVQSYRIPGLATTDRGTLISVFDIRYDNSKDLPANIDVGMSRSTDGGKTWSAMKAIIDMGGPSENSGAGDPAVLFDPVTKTIWVAALWSKGNRSIAGSGPGLTPDETGQFVLTSSKDDGLTWSKPYSITAQVKNPEWRLFFPGPGSGIAMADGKIVFAAQYWDANKMPHSTLVYSADHGKSWKSGIGAKSNTTESQLVEVAPGKLMLNMRDNRGKFRSVATTTDMGLSWTEHPTSQKALPDPVCMASIIKARVQVKGKLQDVLFFSNANVPLGPRRDISIKASLDNGETWRPANTLLLDTRECFGYSALSRIDDHTIGILYEGINSLQFLRVPVNEIIKQSESTRN
jgi:sialidase-1